MKAIAMIFLMFCLISNTLSAQRTITGTVTDESGSPLPGVTVTDDKQNGTMTNLEGKYSITVSEKAEFLTFSFVGMKTEKVKITNTVMNVVMKAEEGEMSEIVVTGYAEEKQKITKEKREYSKSLNGRAAGVMIRGTSTLGSDLPQENFNTESYGVINENKFLDVANNPLSTFSVDVDKASYSNVRRFLTGNQMPPIDAVRIEELVNYFHYDYPQPTDEHPFSINLEMAKCMWNEKHYLVKIGLKGKEIAAEKLPPSNLVFLLDVSGSMSSPNKLPLLKSAFKILIEKLRSEDRISIVVYAGAAGLVLPPTSGSEKEKINQALDKLEAGGSTAGGEGIELAYKTAKESYLKEGNNRVILATDGDFNIGASSDAEMVRLIEKKRNDGIFLTVLGFGMGNYKDSKMEQISNAGNGNYAYIDNILEAKKVLGKEIWGTLYTIAKDVKIQIEFNPAKVKAYRLIGYENRLLNKEDFNDDKKDAGEIGAGHTVTAFYEVIPAGSDEKVSDVDKLEYQKSEPVKSDNMMTVKLRYKEPKADDSKLIEKRIKEGEIKTSKLSDDFRFAAAVIEFGMLLRKSEFVGEANYAEAKKLASEAKGKDTDGYRAEMIKLIEIAELLAK